MSFDCRNLRVRIIDKFGSLGSFAKALGKNASFVSITLSGKRNMTRREIFQWAELLEIECNEIGLYFFALKVS